MSKYLVIVESPAKSKTIEKYLGDDYVVMSSKGHIRDLTTRGFGGFGVDIEDNFKPMYKVLKDKKDIVKELKQAVKTIDKVFLATDPDREGEAISWHLLEALELEGKEYERIVFHEITKNAILNALDNGREVDINLVRSQESRRILDRIIGFSLSKLLQRKIGSKSAGRVQSIALKLIVDKEREIESFNPEEYWEVFCEFKKDKEKLKAKLASHKNAKIKLTSEKETNEVLENLGKDYVVSEIINKERAKTSKPPFITSTLQQESSSKFNFNARKTMQIAQKLYEGIELGEERVGLVTYIRTDSQRLSKEFLDEGKKFVIKEFGAKYYSPYKDSVKKGKNIQDAHEAIRPSNVDYTPEYVKKYLTNDEYKLYTIIYNRAISCLMSNAIIDDEKVKIINNDYIFEITGERIVFDGYLKIYSKYDDKEVKTLPKFVEKEKLIDAKISSEQKFTNPPLRFSEARLIRKMEELGIGRPSTYAVTIETLKYRYYIKVDKKIFIPTKQGILTSDKLNEYFSKVINVEYTADMEKILDEISEGEKIWHQELKKFYEDYMPLVDYANENMEKTYPIFLDEDCPKCGSKLVYRNGRYGQFVACSGFPKCRYIKKDEEDEPVNTGVACPVCKEGMLVSRIGKRGKGKGKMFYACNKYPECKTTFSQLPGEEKQSENKSDEEEEERI